MSGRINLPRDRTKSVSTRKIILFAIFAVIEMAIILLLVNLVRMTASRQVVLYLNYSLRFIAILISVYIIFVRKDKSEYRFLWLLLIIIEPILGSIFYLIFAEKRPRESTYSDCSNQTFSALQSGIDTVPDSLKPMAQFIINTQNQRVFLSCKTEVFIPCDAVFLRLVEDIRHAEKYIFLQTFIMSSGDFLTAILDEIEKKRDLNAYFYIDDFGSFASIKHSDMLRIRKLGIKFVRYNKIKVIFRPDSNYRNHRKMIVIDGRVGYVGGMNIADEYLNWKRRFGVWLDSMVRIEGEGVSSLVECFIRDWKASSDVDIENIDIPYFSSPDDRYSSPLQFYTSSPNSISNSNAENILVALILSAKEHIRIITPYLSLTSMIYNALYFARKSGVRIDLIIPGVADKKFVYLETLNTAEKLSKNSINVRLFDKGFSHAKMIIVDEQCVNFSSVNFDYRSFYLSFELGVNIYSQDECERCIRLFEDIFNSSEAYQPPVHKSLIRRICDYFALVLRSYF